VEILIWWLTLSILAGWIAGSKGRNGFGVFVLSLILSPLIGLIVALVLERIEQPDPNAPTPDTHIKCPDCAELIKREAKVCRHCGCKLVPQ